MLVKLSLLSQSEYISQEYPFKKIYKMAVEKLEMVF